MYITKPCFDWTTMSSDGFAPRTARVGGKSKPKCIEPVPAAVSTAPLPLKLNCCPAHGPENEPEKATRTDVNSTLKQETTGTRRGTRSRWRSRNMLLAGQVAACLILLAGAGLLFRGVRHLRTADAGFDTKHVVVPHIMFGEAILVITSHHRIPQMHVFDFGL